MAIAMKWLLAVVFVAAAIGLMVLVATAQDITGGLNNPTNAIIGGVGSGGGFNNPSGTIVGGGGGGGTGHDLLAIAGHPIFSVGTTPILVQ